VFGENVGNGHRQGKASTNYDPKVRRPALLQIFYTASEEGLVGEISCNTPDIALLVPLPWTAGRRIKKPMQFL